jgi:hypothetical protein
MQSYQFTDTVLCIHAPPSDLSAMQAMGPTCEAVLLRVQQSMRPHSAPTVATPSDTSSQVQSVNMTLPGSDQHLLMAAHDPHTGQQQGLQGRQTNHNSSKCKGKEAMPLHLHKTPLPTVGVIVAWKPLFATSPFVKVAGSSL